MQHDTTSETGWQFVAEGEEIATIIDTLLKLDPEETYSRSEFADMTGIPLKTLHLMDDVEELVELGVLEKDDPEGEEVRYSVAENSEILAAAREFGDAVMAEREE